MTQIFQKFCQKGFSIVHPADARYTGGLPLPGGVKPEEWDLFHSIIMNDELNRCVDLPDLLHEVRPDIYTELHIRELYGA